MTTDDKQLWLDAKMAHDQALYNAAHEARHPRTDYIVDPSSVALNAAGKVIAAHTAALRERIAKLEHQLEHEHGFDVALDTFVDDEPPRPKGVELTGEQVFARIEGEIEEPRPSAIKLSQYIPLDSQIVTITRGEARRLIEWVRAIRA